MGKNTESFRYDLVEIRKFLTRKKQIIVLAQRVGVVGRTVTNTFKANSYDDLTGTQLNVYREAIALVKEIKELPSEASKLFDQTV